MRGAWTFALLAVVTSAEVAAARQACRSVDFAGQGPRYCWDLCRMTPEDTWLAGWQPRPQNRPCDRTSSRTNCPPPPDPVPQPWKITSCKVKVIPGGCEITVCGPVASVQDTLRRPSNTTFGNRVLTPKPRVGPPPPELLQDESPLSHNAPSAIGTPLGTGGTRTGGSQGIR